METKHKLRVIKDYDKIAEELLEQIKLVYPQGFRKHLVEFIGLDGKKRKGLPFETEEKYYLIRMTTNEAISVVAEDNDFDEAGNLRGKVQAKLAEKYEGEDHLDDFNSNDDNDFGEDGDDEFDMD